MAEIPETRESLLVRLKDPRDRDAWEQFAALYQPVIYRLARGRGLQDADAQDLSQQVLMAVASAIPSWKPRGENPKFRHWLRRVAKNATINALTRKPRDAAFGGSALMHLLLQTPQVDGATEDAIDWEQRRELYRLAVIEMRASVSDASWEIFARTIINREPVESVSASTGKSVGAIYVARCRMMNRLRDAVQQFQQELEA